MRSAERGLTMLEVLGAAALLAFVYIALTRSEIEGLRSEQESNRRLQASLLADQRLADLELDLASGAAPSLGDVEEEALPPFRVRTEVRAFAPPPPPNDAATLGLREGSLAARHAARQVDPNAPSLLAPPKPGDPDPPLRAIDVVVLWDEGIYEREVRRTTYALDTAAAEAIVGPAVAAAEAAAADQDESAKAASKNASGSRKKQKEATGPGAPTSGQARPNVVDGKPVQ